MNTRFVGSGKYDDLLTIKTSIKKLPSARIEFDYELVNESGDLLATGSTDLVFINMKRNRPMRCPDYLLDKLK